MTGLNNALHEPNGYWPFVIVRLHYSVFSIKRTEEFNDWLNGIRDGMTQRRLVKRLRKVTLGNLGDVKTVGDGIFRDARTLRAGLAHVLHPTRISTDSNAGRW